MHLTGTRVRILAIWIAVAGALASVAVVRGLFDPDYFWHLATGNLILDTGRIPTTDPFSFTWLGEPWIPDQWLGEVAIAAGVGSVGVTVVLIMFSIAAAAGVVASAISARATASWPAILGATVVGAACLIPQVTVRPQALSFAFAGILMYLLVTATPETRTRLFVIPPMFLVWANTHGFFIIGLGVGAIYLAATLIGRTPLSGRRWFATFIAAAAVFATVVTPSGLGGLVYAASFADAGDIGAQAISEWQSPNFHNPQFLPFLVMIGAALLAGLHRAPGWLIGTTVLGALLGLFAARSVGIGALLIIPGVLVASGSRTRMGRVERPRAILELAAGGLVAVVLVGAAMGRAPVAVDPRRVPVEGAEALRTVAPDAQVLAMYEWGGYLIHELGPSGGTVFVDGRMHKYAPSVLADYLSIVGAERGWQSVLARYPVEAMLLSPDAPLTKGAIQREGWCEEFRNENSVLLLTACGGS